MLSPIPQILDDLRAGRMIILVDDEDRENEGDLVLAAECVTPEAINFMVTHARGYLCLSLTEADCDRLDLHPQSPVNTSVRGTPFTVSIDGHPSHGFTTGVSATERADTIRLAIKPDSSPSDFVRPGHINPLRARDGGVLVRVGQTEGSIDLCRLAGLGSSAVIIEIMREDGQMARMPDLEDFAARHDLKICSIAQIIEHRLAREGLVRRQSPIEGEPLRTPFGDFRLIAYESIVDPLPHLALVCGDVGRVDPGSSAPVQRTEPTLVRMHRRNLLGDIFGDLDSTPGPSTAQLLHASMRAIQEEGAGAIVYLRPEGGDESLSNRLTSIRRDVSAKEADAPDFTGGSGDVISPQLREFGVGSQILRDLGLSQLRVLTNAPKNLPGLDSYGLEIVEQVPIQVDGDWK